MAARLCADKGSKASLNLSLFAAEGDNSSLAGQGSIDGLSTASALLASNKGVYTNMPCGVRVSTMQGSASGSRRPGQRLPPGRYTLIASTFQPGREAGFSLKVFAEDESAKLVRVR